MLKCSFIQKNRRSFWTAALAFPVLVAASASLLQNERHLDVGKVAAFAVLLSLLVTCAITDIIWRIIPNWATYTAVFWAVVISAVTDGGSFGEGIADAPTFFRGAVTLPVGVVDGLAGLFACFFIMLAIHSVATGGAGDVKLATAIGALIGMKSGVLALCYTFILAGVASLVVITWSLGPFFVVAALMRRIGSTLLPLHVSAPNTAQSLVLQRPLPLGVFFALGALCSVFDLPGSIQ